MEILDMFKTMIDETSIKTAFRNIKQDITVLNDSHDELKASANEWIMFLDRENRELKARLFEIEGRLSLLEENAERKEVKVQDFSFLNV